MRRTLTILLAGLALLVTAMPAAAITGHWTPDHVHGYVGLVVFYDEDGEFSHRCSGTLIGPSTLLTAGHCIDGGDSARVWFRQDAGANFDGTIDPVSGYPDACFEAAPWCVTASTPGQLLNFGFFGGFPDTHDAGLVILDQPVVAFGFASLAVSGSLDRLATRRGTQDTTFTVSGYGLSSVVPAVTSFRSRLMATVHLTNLRSALTGGFNLQTTGGKGKDRGGTCFGDSGGPVFYSNTQTVVAVTSFGLNLNCVGTDFSYRTDRTPVIDWIVANSPDQITFAALP
jgi:hypothetical protein